MSDKKIINTESLNKLIERMLSEGMRVIAPVKRGEKIVFEEIRQPGEIVKEYIQTEMSPKSAVFPKFEKILEFTRNEDGVIDIHPEGDPARPVIVFSSRPCDARSLEVLDNVFLKEGEDIFYKNRRNNLTMISVSCSSGDKDCFCTSVGSSPGDTSGSDILLTAADGGKYLAEILTPRGEDIVKLEPGIFSDNGSAINKEDYLADIPVKFDREKLLSKTGSSFEHDIYFQQALRCVGCGVCAYVCPTCSCFDIQDETHDNKGIRVRTWDSCGFKNFTLHTSWHNPREVQGKRWRQRIMHKFCYQPDTMGLIGCVGCGRCSRACPVDMSLLDHLKSITEI